MLCSSKSCFFLREHDFLPSGLTAGNKELIASNTTFGTHSRNKHFCPKEASSSTLRIVFLNSKILVAARRQILELHRRRMRPNVRRGLLATPTTMVASDVGICLLWFESKMPHRLGDNRRGSPCE
ncbi:hypothetical protein L484_019812 [Morus notabilis]|uniref:Uncharacterized protein n=1 Tax=Morus notabilis TaxID=981085 RepID=W9SI87_9ROSA|nr:hypothetical protein L484_019812 [Morus notabilis]